MEDKNDELRPEYDVTKLRVRRMGTGRRSFNGVVNPDYDERFDPSRYFRGVILSAKEASEDAQTEVGIEGKLSLPASSAITLDSDVAGVFRDAAAVNAALRAVIRMAGDPSTVAEANDRHG